MIKLTGKLFAFSVNFGTVSPDLSVIGTCLALTYWYTNSFYPSAIVSFLLCT